MAKPTAELVLPIYVKFSGKDYHVGDLTMTVKVVAGKIKAPTPREIKTALKKGL